MEYIIVTGLTGSGKTTFAKNLGVKSLSYDNVYNYNNGSLSYDNIEKFLNDNKNETVLYLDAYNEDLIEYLRNRDNNVKFSCIMIYTDLDNYYDILMIKDPRNFISGDNTTYETYVNAMIVTINQILESIKKINCEIIYKYRTTNNEYIDHNNDKHLIGILNETKKDRLLNYIDEVSGHSSYQSIILNKEYIKRGSEKDWISFDNILKCTSIDGKIICDTGCFNGYFSFRCIKEGAKKIIGIDHNKPAINICNRLCIYNNYHLWKMGNKTDVSCEDGIEFHLKKIGSDKIFDGTENIDVIFALNYLHHLKRELGDDAFINTIDSFFKNSKEVIFEVNDSEIQYIEKLADENGFTLDNKIESHRKTSVGDIQNVVFQDVCLNTIGFDNSASEVIKSDYFRYYIINKHGGLWSDFDILYTGSIEEKMNFGNDSVIFRCFANGGVYYPIGLLMSVANSKIYRYILNQCKDNYDSNNYQTIGASMLIKLFPSIDDIYKIDKSTKICNESYYLPWAWNQLDEFLVNTDNILPYSNVGIHWFNGADKSKDYTINLDKRIENKFKIECYLDKFVYEYLTVNTVFNYFVNNFKI